jgi:acyl carrier protein
VPDGPAIAAQVREVLLSAWPQRFVPAQLRDEVSLGESGLGLDSIEIVEVLLACEEESGSPITEALFAVTPLTISRVVEHFAAA